MADQDKMDTQPGQEIVLDLDPGDTEPGQETVKGQPLSTSEEKFGERRYSNKSNL